MQAFEFGPFRLSLREQQLQRDGVALPLTPKEFQLLRYLVEHPAQLISREDLLAAVWPGLAVDDNNLAVHVSALRRVLGDSAASPTFIETVPRRGYRFVAPVLEVIPPSPTPPPPAAASRLRPWMAAVATAGSLALAGWWIGARAPESVWDPQPFTSLPGLESSPVFSPDGRRVLYSMFIPKGRIDEKGHAHPGGGLWMKDLDAAEPARVTSEIDMNPAWSPDGSEIAFARFLGDTAFLTVRPSAGGSDQRLLDLNFNGPLPGPFVSYSPDGKWLLTSVNTGTLAGLPPRKLVAVERASGRVQDLLPPVGGSAGDSAPVLSPRGDRLVFCRCASTSFCDLYDVRVRGLSAQGTPRRLTFVPSSEFRALFLPDGSLLYSVGAPGSRLLYRLRFDWRDQPHTTQVSASGEDALSPAGFAGPGGRLRLVYVRTSIDPNIWRVDLDSPGGHRVSAQPFLASTRWEETPAYSPDGRAIAFATNRTGNWEIWVCGTDEQNCRLVTHSRLSYARYPQWSPDGRWIVFEARTEMNTHLFLVSADGSPERQLTAGDFAATEPAWSRDGKWLYFASNRSGRFELYRSPAPSADQPRISFEAVTSMGAAAPRLSPDGRSLFFRGGDRKFYDLDLETQEITPLRDATWITTPVPAGDRAAYGYRFDIQFGKGFLARWDRRTDELRNLQEALLDRPLGLTVSPDERQVLFVQTDRNESDLMIAEGLRY